MLPVLVILGTVAVLLVAPHAGPMFPQTNADGTETTFFPGFVWIEVAVYGALLATGICMIIYETVATVRFGRTLGKRWMHIRPVRLDGRRPGWGRSFGRVALYWVAGWLSGFGVFDVLWCLWDDNQQCLHDKAVDTIVINDTVVIDTAAIDNAVIEPR